MRYPKHILEDPLVNTFIVKGDGGQIGECANLAGCKSDIMEHLATTDAEAEEVASSGVPVCIPWVRVQSDNMKEECSHMFENFTGDAEDVKKAYVGTIRKW